MASSSDFEPAVFAEIRAVLNERVMAIDGAMGTFVALSSLQFFLFAFLCIIPIAYMKQTL